MNKNWSSFLLAQQTAKETVYSLVVVAGVMTLGGLGFLTLHEFYSRETPNGIYKEAAQICLANIDVSWLGQSNCNLIFNCTGSRSIGCANIGAYDTTSWFNAY